MAPPAPPAGPSSAPFQNIYYQRKVATEKPCYICRRPTATVLATLKTEDFLYTCDGHLTDPASPIAPPPAPSGPSEEEIRKVVSDYHAKEAKKKEAADTDKDKDKEKEKDGGRKASPPLSIPGIPPAGGAAAAGHKKYALHRQIFDMRRMEMKRKEQGVKAREVGRGLPQVPRGAF